MSTSRTLDSRDEAECLKENLGVSYWHLDEGHTGLSRHRDEYRPARRCTMTNLSGRWTGHETTGINS